MKTVALLSAVLIAALAVAGLSYWLGKAARQAEQDHQAVADLSTILQSQTKLVKQANAASRAMRQATARREAADQQTTEELRHALAATADSRTDCAFPADVLRQLQAARDRAADAAAGGIRGEMSQPADGAGQP